MWSSSHSRITALASLLALAAPLAGCFTFNGARPLEPGEHQAGVTLGGPIVQLGAPIPLPQATLEGRSGVAKPLDRPLDVHYGLGATGLAFGILNLHAGASWLLFDQAGWRPALSLTNRVFFATNILTTGDRAEGQKGVWALDQVELTTSYALGDHLVYLGLAQYTDFRTPSLLLTPVLGGELDPGEAGGVKLQLEGRYFGVNRYRQITTIDWWPGQRGALGLSFGISYAFSGGCSCKDD